MEHRTDIRWNQRPIVMESADHLKLQLDELHATDANGFSDLVYETGVFRGRRALLSLTTGGSAANAIGSPPRRAGSPKARRSAALRNPSPRR
jgi:hypothetical protein